MRNAPQWAKINFFWLLFVSSLFLGTIFLNSLAVKWPKNVGRHYWIIPYRETPLLGNPLTGKLPYRVTPLLREVHISYEEFEKNI